MKFAQINNKISIKIGNESVRETENFLVAMFYSILIMEQYFFLITSSFPYTFVFHLFLELILVAKIYLLILYVLL